MHAIGRKLHVGGQRIWQYEMALRMYCIDTPRVPESSDAGTFHCLYD